jgi:DNA polymerase IV
MKATLGKRRRILHVDLDPFFVAVERSLAPELRDRPIVIGGSDDTSGLVAAASLEALARGVRPGQPIALAKRLCPEAALRRGDFEAYTRISQELTGILLRRTRRVERPSAAEAFLDISHEKRRTMTIVEELRHEIERQLHLDAAFGLASGRLTARIASNWAKPRGLLVILPEHELAFLRQQPLEVLSEELPSRALLALQDAGMRLLGQIIDAEEASLSSIVGGGLAARIRAVLDPSLEAGIEPMTPPPFVFSETTLRSPSTDEQALGPITEALLARSVQQVRPFGVGVGALSLEVEQAGLARRAVNTFALGLQDEAQLSVAALMLLRRLLAPSATVTRLRIQLSDFRANNQQYSLFPGLSETG